MSTPTLNPRAVIDGAVAAGEIPGAVAIYGTATTIQAPIAAGFRRLDGPATTPDTRYDLASLTKVVSTLPCVLRLLTDGAVRLDDPVRRFISNAGWFQSPSLGDATIRELLTHTAGLPAWEPLYTRTNDRLVGLGAALQTARPNIGQVVYSDLGFIVLGAIIERVCGQRQDAFLREVVLDPMGMAETGYGPAGPPVAATENCGWRTCVLEGVVHDENAYALGGVAGHAGLFGTAGDLAAYCQAWLRGDPRLGDPGLLAKARSEQATGPGVRRALGWLLKGEGSFAGPAASLQGYGHTGFTGTSLWIEPDAGWFAVLLTNRVHPHRSGGPNIQQIRRDFHHAVGARRQEID